MMQNKKLQDLSANIRSSRDNAAVIEDVPDILNPQGDEICADFLWENPGIASRLGIKSERMEHQFGLAHMLTQRLALLAAPLQKVVYDELFDAYRDAVIEKEIEDGSVDVFDWRARTVDVSKAWGRSEEHTSELQSLMRISYAVFCLKKKN